MTDMKEKKGHALIFAHENTRAAVAVAIERKAKKKESNGL